jgi:zinc transport system substrate-binding protein
MKNNKTGITIVIALLLLLIGGALLLNKIRNDNKILIVATNFPAYDFARAVVGDEVEVKMLLKPGAETHDFEPTPQDIIDIKKSTLFIYTGGESDEWVSGIIENANTPVRMMDAVETVKEEGEDEDDEHVWTNPQNAIKIVKQIYDAAAKELPEYKLKFAENSAKYESKLLDLDDEFREVVANAKRHTLVFGDRFPLRYFVDEYGLKYYAAFPGCSEQTEADAKTIATLIDVVKSENIPVVFKIELSNSKVADAISAETGAKVLTFNSAHNISAEDFENGVTYVDLMTQNIEVLKEALN